MRPRIVEALNALFDTSVFHWLIPVPAVIYAIAMLVAFIVWMRRSKSSDLSTFHITGAAFCMMVAGLLGTRVFFLIQHWRETLAHPQQIFDPTGGLTSWGAYLGGVIGLLLYCRFYRLRVLPYADAAVPCLGLGIALGRWSCFLNGDDYGTLSSLPWAVRFPHGSYPFVAQVQAGLLSPLQDLSLPIHPVQLYLSLNGLALFFLASWFYKRFRLLRGATFCFYWILYCSTRFLLEFFRGDQKQLFLGTFTVPQLMSILTVIPASIALWYVLRRHKEQSPEPTPAMDSRIAEAA